MIKASGMRSGGSSRRKVHKPIKRRVFHATRGITPSRVASGNWNLFGLVHGGKEGKQWQKAKDLVTAAQNQAQFAVTKIKSEYIVGIWKKSKLSADDKNRLINQIKAMTFK